MKHWDRQEIEAMAAMRRDGKALTAIAEAWGVSRMVVAGIARRNPELFPVREKKTAADKAAERKTKAAKLLAKRKKAAGTGTVDKPRLIPVEAYDTQHMQLPGAPTVAFIDCGEFRCRLVLTPGGERLGPDTPCCGRPVAEGSAYCPEHQKLMYRPYIKRTPAW
ncbi:GcrA family cell cycle regulator [Martelella soudanensis]|uniref:GcrA family cell cycle regulator n=1 Tax=unclassified Martelella TaxID=2629616 RepID=UPI0015DE8C09|nr:MULTISPECIES: GcrA family cell cycle regulator [unclassified Martelella]